MAKLYYKYGVMGSSKTAQALITKFNYEERCHKVLLLKPATDTRDGVAIIKSRIGLEQSAVIIQEQDNITDLLKSNYNVDVIIVDECQFLTRLHVDQLRTIASFFDVPVLCFGLRTDFQQRLFEGSKALFELADSVQEIKSICDCGNKAIVNARVDSFGMIIIEGDTIQLGGNDCYIPMCWKCYMEKIISERVGKNAKESKEKDK